MRENKPPCSCKKRFANSPTACTSWFAGSGYRFASFDIAAACRPSPASDLSKTTIIAEVGETVDVPRKLAASSMIPPMRNEFFFVRCTATCSARKHPAFKESRGFEFYQNPMPAKGASKRSPVEPYGGDATRTQCIPWPSIRTCWVPARRRPLPQFGRCQTQSSSQSDSHSTRTQLLIKCSL
jgi:hypothetical protein